MTLIRLGRNGTVFGLAVSMLIFGGWFGKKESPLLPVNSILAAYTTNGTKEAPVMKEFGRVFDTKWAVLSELLKESKPGVLEKIADDPFKTYLAIDRQEIEWSLLTMGELTHPATAKDAFLPDTTWTLCGPFNKEKTITALTQHIQSNYPGMRLEASSLDGRPIWTLRGEAISKVRGLNPCLSFSGKRLMLVASNEKALRRLLDLYAGKGPGLSKESPLWRVLETSPVLISRLMIVNLSDVMKKLTTEAERAEMLTDPKMNAVVNSVRDLTAETRLVPSRDAAELIVRVGCADAGNAQTLNELCITAKVSASFMLTMAMQKRPELKGVQEWLSKVNSRTEGKETTLSLRCLPQDIQNVDVKKLMDRKVNKIKKNNPSALPHPQRGAAKRAQ